MPLSPASLGRMADFSSPTADVPDAVTRGTDRAASRWWAERARLSGFSGIVYRLTRDPCQEALGLALFNVAGNTTSWGLRRRPSLSSGSRARRRSGSRTAFVTRPGNPRCELRATTTGKLPGAEIGSAQPGALPCRTEGAPRLPASGTLTPYGRTSRVAAGQGCRLRRSSSRDARAILASSVGGRGCWCACSGRRGRARRLGPRRIPVCWEGACQGDTRVSRQSVVQRRRSLPTLIRGSSGVTGCHPDPPRTTKDRRSHSHPTPVSQDNPNAAEIPRVN